MNRLLTLPFLLIAFLLGGCGGGGGQQYYLLTAAGPAPTGGGPGIGVGPVTVAEYLDRSNLIFQSGSQRLEIATDELWAGDMKRSIATVTSTNLGRLVGSGNLRTYPWENDKELRYQVSLDIRQFHGTADGHALLEASWRVYRLPEGTLITSRSGTFRERQKTDGFDELAAAQSRALQQLAKEIAKNLK